MNWLFTSLFGNLNDRKSCLTFWRLEDKLSHGYKQIHQLGAEIDEPIRRKERSKKIATTVQWYLQLLDQMDKIDNLSFRHFKPDANERLSLQQR